MRYRVTGADARSSQPVELILEAESDVAASADALTRGIAPTRVEPLAPDAPLSSPAAPGSPAEPLLVRIEPGHVQLIERTAKSWKALLGFSALLMVAGAASCAWSVAGDPRAITDPPRLVLIGGVLGVIGFVGFVIARLGAWWHHG